MVAVIQRVIEASVQINGQNHNEIGNGLLVLVGVHQDDSLQDAEWLAAKIGSLRIFADQEGKMNLSVSEAAGSMLVISQFTLIASTKKGNRPSFIDAAKPDYALPVFDFIIEYLRENSGVTVKTGEFGADMKISLTNDGPVTIVLDTKNKH